MKCLQCLSLLFIVVAFSGCDTEMQGVMKPIAEEVMGDPVTEPESADLPLIDSTELEPGLYRMNVTSGHVSSDNVISLGTLPMPEIEDVIVTVILYPMVEELNYGNFLDAEVVVRIYAKDISPPITDDTGAIFHFYHGSVVKVLKKTLNSEIVYAYEPTGYEGLPVLETAFARGEVQPGRYLMFTDSYDWDNENYTLLSVYCDTAEENILIGVVLEKRPDLYKKDDNIIFSRSWAVLVDITNILGVSTKTANDVTYTIHDLFRRYPRYFWGPGHPRVCG